MKITVTKEDIRKGKRFDPRACPVYWAIKRSVSNPSEFFVNRLALRSESCEQEICRFPDSVTEFIDRFDLKKPVKPFSFNLKLPK